jgi:endonuclease-8
VPQIGRIIGHEITEVEALGKNLLIRFDNGLEVRTHLRMNGSWHRYRPGERWRRPPSRARLVLEVPGAVAVCFDAPVVELLEQRAESLHAPLGGLGPDLLSPEFDADEALRRLRAPARRDLTISAALLDQRALAGIGNIWRNETLFAERVDPLARVADLDDATLHRLIATARALLTASAGVAPGRAPQRVYARTGRPCPRCGTVIQSGPLPGENPRTTYWCPACQGGTSS